MGPNFKKGDKVHYHPVIGERHDGKVYECRTDIEALPSGHAVVWLKGKAGCVSVLALSHAE